MKIGKPSNGSSSISGTVQADRLWFSQRQAERQPMISVSHWGLIALPEDAWSDWQQAWTFNQADAYFIYTPEGVEKF